MPLACEQYSKTGVVGGNREDVLALSSNRKGRVSPMLAVSSASNGDLALHCGSDPLPGFHVAEAFDKPHAKSEDMEIVVGVPKSEFRKWCIAFSRCLTERRVQLTLFYGEAVRLCYELQAHIQGGETTPNISRLYKNVWRSTSLQISMLDNDGQIPTFDVIDTSKLVDHVGILMSCRLSRRCSVGVLHLSFTPSGCWSPPRIWQRPLGACCARMLTYWLSRLGWHLSAI